MAKLEQAAQEYAAQRIKLPEIQKSEDFNLIDDVIYDSFLDGAAYERKRSEGLLSALNYYAKELEWREVEQTMNFCSDDCPRDCHNHTMKYKSKIRSAGHSMKTAQEALKKYEDGKDE